MLTGSIAIAGTSGISSYQRHEQKADSASARKINEQTAKQNAINAQDLELRAKFEAIIQKIKNNPNVRDEVIAKLNKILAQ